jgi:hypothetical protein
LSRAENQANGGACDTSQNRMQAGAPEDRKNDLMPGSWFEAWSTAARHVQAECLYGLEIDDQLELVGELHRQIGRRHH